MIAVLFFGLVGIIFAYLGLMAFNGTYKRWYLGPRILPPQALVYASIPFGLASLLLCIASVFGIFQESDISGWMIDFLVFPMTLAGFILAFWRPKWIKPYWVRWLEENYADNIYTLIAEAQKNPGAWEAQIATQKGLEEWAEKIAGKPGPRRRFL